MGITWNDCIEIIPVMAKRKRTIIEHENACNDLITMFLVHFGYKTHSRIALKLTDILWAFYSSKIESNKITSWFRTDNADDVLMELSRLVHAE